MFTVNRTLLKTEANKPGAKGILGNTIIIVADSYKNGVWNVIDTVSGFTSYEMANWTIGIDRWIENRMIQENTSTYDRATIVMADLGGDNFKYEPSFEHPCIVLVNKYNRLMVAPASSGRYKCGYKDVIDVTATPGGFKKDSGIQMESVRWIHKNRVTGIIGKATPTVMQQIDDYLLQQIPTSRKHQTMIRYLQSDVTQKDTQISALQIDVQQRDSQITQLNADIQYRDQKIVTPMKERLERIMGIIQSNPDMLRWLEEEAAKNGLDIEEAN